MSDYLEGYNDGRSAGHVEAVIAALMSAATTGIAFLIYLVNT
jgi:hypothetical protein